MEIFTETELNRGKDFYLGTNVDIKGPSKAYPFLVSPKADINVFEWATNYKEQLNSALLEHGAILLRGFDIGGAEKFNELFSIISGDAMEYKNRTSPRDQVYSNVYTSTSHPKSETIHMHTENSYSNVYNRIIAFYSLIPAAKGGETPIADERKLLKSLKPETVQKFREKGIQYVRNSMFGIGLPWQTIYQTEDKNKVGEILDGFGHEYAWIDDDHIRIKWSLPAFQMHPITKEEVWFNHMYFGHKSLYDSAIIEFLGEENLPFATYFGDGEEIDENIINEFKSYYENHSIVFRWQKDDFLLIDNMMFSHGRKPFEGERTTLTAMGQAQELKH